MTRPARVRIGEGYDFMPVCILDLEEVSALKRAHFLKNQRGSMVWVGLIILIAVIAVAVAAIQFFPRPPAPAPPPAAVRVKIPPMPIPHADPIPQMPQPPATDPEAAPLGQVPTAQALTEDAQTGHAAPSDKAATTVEKVGPEDLSVIEEQSVTVVPTGDADVEATAPAVDVPVAQPSPAGTVTENETRFAIQTGAYRTKAYAENNAAELKRLGYPSLIVELMDENAKLLYLVRFGRFQTREEAVAAADVFKEKEKMPAVVVRAKAQ